VAEENDVTRKIYIQVCLEFTTEATYQRYVVTLDNNWRADENGVMGIHLKDFLLKETL